MILRRIAAYIIDFLLIALVGNLLGSALPNQNKINELSEQALYLMNEYLEVVSNKDKEKEEMLTNQINDISYDTAKATYVNSIVTIGLYILYFIVFQRYNNGQTIGKKLLKIEVSSSDGEEASIKQFIIRGIIIYPILFDLINVGVLLLFSRSIYENIIGWTSILQLILMVACLVTLFMKRPIHDSLAKTQVVLSGASDAENVSNADRWKDNIEKEKNMKKYKTNHTSGKRKG